jgi:hypothetical protein
MMSFVFRLFLTLASLMLSLVVFCVNQDIVINSLHPYFSSLPKIISYILYLILVFEITGISNLLSKFLGSDTLDGRSIASIEPANDAFLPSYLGYFFVALIVNSIEMFFFVFGIICFLFSIPAFHISIPYFSCLDLIFITSSMIKGLKFY